MMRSDSLGASTMREGASADLGGSRELEKKRCTTFLVHARNISCSVQRTHVLPTLCKADVSSADSDCPG